MIRINIVYPRKEDTRFDFDYYLNTHMPLSIKLLSAHPGYKGVTVEKGLVEKTQGSKSGFMAACRFTFESVETFMEAFQAHAEELQGDIVNYTNSKAVIHFSKVLL